MSVCVHMNYENPCQITECTEGELYNMKNEETAGSIMVFVFKHVCFMN